MEKATVIIERFKEGSGKYYDSITYTTDVADYTDKFALIEEAKSEWNLQGFNFTLEVSYGQAWNKYLIT